MTREFTPSRAAAASRRHLLSDAKEIDLCARYAAGEDAPELAPQFGITAAYVYKVLTRRKTPRRNKSDCHKTKTLREDAFSLPLSDAAAYWAGFLMADGSVGRTEDQRAPAISLDLADVDVDHVAAFRSFVGSSHNLQHRAENKSTRAQFRSARIAADLAVLGVTPSKSTREEASGHVSLNRHFWRGFADGDGCYHWHVGNTPQFALCGSRKILSRFVSFLKSNGVEVDGRASIGEHRGTHQLALYGDRTRDWIRLAYMGDAGLVCLRRKRALAMEIVERR